jgi:CBS domain-containing protein
MRLRRVRDIMATEVVTLRSDDSLQLAKDIMTLGRIRHFPVVEGSRVVGVVSQRDLFLASLGSALKHGQSFERAYLDTIPVKDVMKAPARTIAPQAPITDAAREMLEKRIGCLPVVEGERLVGLVTETDLLRVLVELAGE